MRTLFLSSFVLLAACGPDHKTTTPTKGPITESVYASGVVKARGQYTVFPTVNGTVTALLVAEGDTVKAGQPILSIDERTSKYTTLSSTAQVRLLELNAREDGPVLGQLREAIVQAHDKYEVDSLNYTRQAALWAKQIGSQNERDQRELAFTTSRATYIRARKAYEETRNRLRTDLDVARNNAAISNAANDDRTPRSLIDGIVYDLMIEPGELASTQRGVAVIGSATDLYLELEVDEYDIQKVKPGQRIYARFDSYADSAFAAKVSRIIPLMDERSRTFRVEARFIDQPPPLFPNLTVEANIVLRTKQDALTIPASYIVDGNFVLIDTGKKQRVTLGARDLDKVEVLDGIGISTTIYEP